MKLSFVVTTHGATKTSSSSRQYAVMYAFDWIRQRAPMTVSFSTQTPRPTTLPSPTVHALADRRQVADHAAGAERDARRDDGAGRDRGAVADHQRRQRLAAGGGRPAERGLLADHGVVADAHAGADHRAGVDHDVRAEHAAHRHRASTGLPAVVERALQRRQRLDHREALGAATRSASCPVRMASTNARISSCSGSSAGDARDVRVARLQRLELAPGLEPRRPRPLLVHRHLAVGLGVVEHGHRARCRRPSACGACAGRATRRAGARSMPDGNRTNAEDDVLDAGLQVALAARRHLAGPLAGQRQRERQVVRREAPERVLVLPHLAEVLAVRVQVQHPAERRRRRPAPSPSRTPGGSAAGGRPSAAGRAARRSATRSAACSTRQRERLLDEQVLAGLEHLRADRMVRRASRSRPRPRRACRRRAGRRAGR